MKETDDRGIFPYSLKLNNENIFTVGQNNIVKSILKGKKDQEIADEYDISIKTVRSHKYGNYSFSHRKTSLGICGLMEKETGKRPQNKAELIRMLIENGIVEITETF